MAHPSLRWGQKLQGRLVCMALGGWGDRTLWANEPLLFCGAFASPSSLLLGLSGEHRFVSKANLKAALWVSEPCLCVISEMLTSEASASACKIRALWTSFQGKELGDWCRKSPFPTERVFSGP